MKILTQSLLRGVFVLLPALLLAACKTGGTASTDANNGGNAGNGAGSTSEDTSTMQYVVFMQSEVVAGKINSSLYKIREDGQNQTTLSNDSGANFFRAVSPSGRVIFNYINSYGQEYLTSVAADGTDRVTLLSGLDVDEYSVQAVTSDNRLILKREVGGSNAFPGNWDIHSLPANGSGSKIVLAEAAEHDYFEALVNDNRVVYTVAALNNPVRSINADGTGAVLLDEYIADYGGVTPDGHVILSLFGQNVAEDLYAIAADGSGTPTALDTTLNRNKTFVGATPDSRVVYDLTSGVARDFYIINLDGSGRTQLTQTPTEREYFAAALPDGRIVIETEAETGGQRDVYIVNPDGTGLTPLANTADDERFVAAHGTERAIFRRVISGHDELHSIRPDGSDSVRIVESGALDSTFYALTNNGRVIYRVSGTGTGADIYTVKVDGSDARPLVNSTINDNFGGLL